MLLLLPLPVAPLPNRRARLVSPWLLRPRRPVVLLVRQRNRRVLTPPLLDVPLERQQLRPVLLPLLRPWLRVAVLALLRLCPVLMLPRLVVQLRWRRRFVVPMPVLLAWWPAKRRQMQLWLVVLLPLQRLWPPLKLLVLLPSSLVQTLRSSVRLRVRQQLRPVLTLLLLAVLPPPLLLFGALMLLLRPV